MVESRWVERQLGHPVIKVFNNIYFHSFAYSGKPTGTPHRIALPVAGDNAEHKRTVVALLDQCGSMAWMSAGWTTAGVSSLARLLI